MAALGIERVLEVHHWTDTQFTFTTTRHPGLRFASGQFVMLGLALAERPLLRAYSIASANHEDELRFLSIKVPDGPLTSRLQHLRAGDEILVSRKPTGTLLLDDLKPGERLYLLSTGTGAAPFMSLVRDPEAYQRFRQIIFVHGVRYLKESAVVRHQIDALLRHELLGPAARAHHHPHRVRAPVRGPRAAAARATHRPRHGMRQRRNAGGQLRAARRARFHHVPADRCGRGLRDRAGVREPLSHFIQPGRGRRARSRSRATVRPPPCRAVR